MRQESPPTGDGRDCHFSKLPVRQESMFYLRLGDPFISKLPVRQESMRAAPCELSFVAKLPVRQESI